MKKKAGEVIKTKAVKKNKKKTEVKRKTSSIKKLQYDFINSTSHQLRTPIASIQSSLDVLELYINKENTARQIQVVNKIKKSLDGLKDTLERITTLYKSEVANTKLKNVKLEPHKFFNDILDEIMVLSGEMYFININFELTKKYIYADEFVLKQIIINLLNNAVKFTPGGGQIRMFVKSDKNTLKISIKDEGIGISKKDIKKLFNPFFRGSNVSAIPGDGLGLAIVKKLCSLHKAEIFCESEVNRGTEFILTIPQ
jgi:signal transduction histidine kinase